MKYLAFIITPFITAGLCSPVTADAGYTRGGAADIPAIESFSTWTQFAYPDTRTPAIDETGCLDYSLAKIAVRYNLPLENADVFSDSYDYYTEFVSEAINPKYTKAAYFSEYFSPFVEYVSNEAIKAGSPESSWRAAYKYCLSRSENAEAVFILKLTTGSGSTHYVAVENIDKKNKRLYLYDSGYTLSEYLGDQVSEKKSYHVTAISTMEVKSLPGDFDKNYELGLSDAVLLSSYLFQTDEYTAAYDANWDGKLNAEDISYILRYAEATQKL